MHLHETGYLRLVLPREYGGEGANTFEMVLAQEHLARGDGATALATSMLVQIIGCNAEQRGWPEPIFAQVCQTLAHEGGLINSVVTEPELGSISRGATPADAPGLRLEHTWQDSLSLRSVGNDDVYFDNAFMPNDWLAGCGASL